MLGHRQPFRAGRTLPTLLVFARHYPENVLNHCTKGAEDVFMANFMVYEAYGGSEGSRGGRGEVRKKARGSDYYRLSWDNSYVRAYDVS